MDLRQDVSELIRALRLVMVIGLVFVHFGNFPGEALDPFSGVINPNYFLASSLNSFFTYFFLCSVPILSLISGYLFSYKNEITYLDTLKKKYKTLVKPYLTWTLLWVLFAFVLFKIGQSSGRFTYFDLGFDNYSLLTFMNNVVGLTEAPFAFQFWFVHDLILSILITPFLFWTFKRLGWIMVLIPFTLWLLEFEALVFFNYKVISFFALGLYVGHKDIALSLPKRFALLNLSILAFIILVLTRIYLPASNDGVMPFEVQFELLLRVIGSIAIITLTLHLRQWLPSFYRFLVKQSGKAFYLHAFHFPVVILVKQVLFSLGLFSGNLGHIALWLASVLITVLLAFLTAQATHITVPSLYRHLNGQRTI